MAGDFRVEVVRSVVVVSHLGRLEYADTNKAIAAAVAAAVEIGGKRILFDLSRADVSNYYSYSVRHAEFAPDLGLDTTYKLAFVGGSEAVDLLSFIETVTRNRGWKSRYFVDTDAAITWLIEDAA
jgi:hypothetical protein